MAEVTILQVVPRLDTGGSEQATVEIAEALTQAGALPSLPPKGAGWQPRSPRRRRDRHIPGGEQEPAHDPGQCAAARASDRGARSRSRACQKPRACLERIACGAADGRPFVTTYHGAYGNPGPFKTFYNSVMARGDRVIANSRYTADLSRRGTWPRRQNSRHLSRRRPRQIRARGDRASAGWRGCGRLWDTANTSPWCCRRRG